MKIKVWWMLVLAVTMLCPFSGAAAETLTLEASIDIALKNSLTIHYAKEGVEAAAAQSFEAYFNSGLAGQAEEVVIGLEENVLQEWVRDLDCSAVGLLVLITQSL